MKRYSLILLMLCALLAGCHNGNPYDQEEQSPAEVTEPSGGEPSFPVNPTPPAEDTSPDNPSPPPSPIPSVDLSKDWETNALTMSEKTYQQTFQANNVDTMTASGRVPQVGQTDIDAYYERVLEDFERACSVLAGDAATDPNGRTYMSDMSYAVECNAGGILSIARRIVKYEGGAHEGIDVLCETFSVADGRLLTLDDFFNVGREKYIDRLLVLIDIEFDENPDMFYENAKELARENFPYDTFLITQDGISLLFPVYSVAPYAAGVVTADVPWGAVSDIWRMP